VHRQTRIRPRAVVWGLVVAACLIAAMAGPGMAAQDPNPEPLWNAYPLDDDQGSSASQNASTTSTPSQPAASPASTTTQAPLTVTDQAGDGPPWVLMIAAAAGGALFVVVLLTLQGRRSRRRDEGPLVGAAEEWPWLTAKANGEADEFRVERLRDAPGMPTTNGTVEERRVAPAANGVEAQRAVEREPMAEPAPNGAAAERVTEPERAGEAERGAEPERVGEPSTDGAAAEPVSPSAEPAFDVVAADAVPRHRFDREPEASNGRSASARRGPICQVRWSQPGTCFYAVTTDADGVEHRLAWSPPIEWREPGPPDEDSREARAALRVLSKDLRDKGWRPMRAKGDDFDETRWYARRFRYAVAEGDDDAAPWQHGPPAAAARGEG
jgi:hypothetical protein